METVAQEVRGRLAFVAMAMRGKRGRGGRYDDNAVVATALKNAAYKLGIKLTLDGELPEGALQQIGREIGVSKRTIERWRLHGKIVTGNLGAVIRLSKLSDIRVELLADLSGRTPRR